MRRTPEGTAMSVVMLDQAAVAKLARQQMPVMIIDPDGKFVGHFVPSAPAAGTVVEPQISREELERRFNRTGGRTLAEIMADLERRA
jgi:CRISPR/Cas system-associated endonuclease Cas1